MIFTHHGMNSILRAKGPSYGSVVIGDKTYRTVIIGNQEWIVENLDWKWEGLIIGANPDPYAIEYEQAYYYNNDETTYGWNGNQCGLLYNWYAIKYLDENADMMLPEGWRVPSEADWKVLISFVGGELEISKLNSKSSLWYEPGVDEYGFSGLPGGTKTGDGFEGFRSYGEYLSKSVSGFSLADCACVMFYPSGAGWHYRNKYQPFSVRLVRDYPPPVTIGGRSYKTVKMPDGKVWLAENLDWKFDGLTFRDGSAGNEMTDDASIPQAAYYDYDESTYGAEGNKYGLLYNWTAANYINNHWMELGLPEGWHVASNAEWNEMIAAVGENPGTKLKSSTGWPSGGEGIDEYGFNGKPCGVCFPQAEGFYYIDNTYYLLSVNGEDDFYDVPIKMIDSRDFVASSTTDRCSALSIRLVYTPPTELNLPLNTIRMELANGPITPTRGSDKANFTKVEGTENIYDCQLTNMEAYSSVSFEGNTEILGILGAKLHGKFPINWMFSRCSSIKYILNFDASNCLQGESVFSECTSLIYVDNLNLSTDHRYGNTYEGDRSATFYKCSNLKYLNNINITGATSMSSFFAKCESIEEIPLLDTRNVTIMFSLFDGCFLLHKVPLFDTSKVTNMGYMFRNCRSLKTIPLFDTSRVTSMAYMFNSCKDLEEVPLLNTSSVTDMSCMFCMYDSTKNTKLTTIPQFDTKNVQDMGDMFTRCIALTEVPLLNTANVTDMSNMFSQCGALVTIPAFNTSNVTNMEYMFSRCGALVTIPAFNTSNVTNMNRTFAYCTSITTIPLLDTSKVTNMRSMLYGCENLTTVPLFDTNKVTDMGYMFYQCKLLSDIPNFDTSSLTAMDLMFCETSIRTTPQFNTSNVIYMQKAFYNISSLKTIGLLNTDSAVNVSSMFLGCSNVETGALALYQQMSTQTNPPTNHSYCFECGELTWSGRNERAQIPSSWGGTAATS